MPSPCSMIRLLAPLPWLPRPANSFAAGCLAAQTCFGRLMDRRVADRNVAVFRAVALADQDRAASAPGSLVDLSSLAIRDRHDIVFRFENDLPGCLCQVPKTGVSPGPIRISQFGLRPVCTGFEKPGYCESKAFLRETSLERVILSADSAICV